MNSRKTNPKKGPVRAICIRFTPESDAKIDALTESLHCSRDDVARIALVAGLETLLKHHGPGA